MSEGLLCGAPRTLTAPEPRSRLLISPSTYTAYHRDPDGKPGGGLLAVRAGIFRQRCVGHTRGARAIRRGYATTANGGGGDRARSGFASAQRLKGQQ